MIKELIQGCLKGLMLGILATMVACEEPIDLELPTQNKLVVLSNFSPEKPIKLFLTETKEVSDSSINNVYLSEASIQLFEDNQPQGQFMFQQGTSGSVPFYLSNLRPKEGKSYRIIVEAPGFQSAKAEDRVPEKPNIEYFSHSKTLPIGGGPKTNQFSVISKLKIEEENLENEYYHLNCRKDFIWYEVFGGDTIKNITQEYIFFQLPYDLEHQPILHEDGILISGKNIKNFQEEDIEIGFELFFDERWELKGDIYLELRRVTANYYNFHRSVGEQEDNAGNKNILSIPNVSIYNNIENGIGNFSAYHTAIKSIQW